MNKRGLGRGLGALLGAEPETAPDSQLEIALDRIRPNPRQPRKAFEEAALEELTQSIKSTGVLQPIVVRPSGDGYEIVAGERRWRAAKEAGLDRIPAVVRQVTDAQSLELALVENLLREDLNPIEAAEGYRQLLTEFNWTQEELGQRIGKDRSSIANALRLLRLPALIQDDLRAGRLTMGHAIALLTLTRSEDQLKLRDEIIRHSWSVRAAEEDVQRKRGLATTSGRRRSAELVAVEESLQHALMARVRIVGNDRRGRIEITYANPDELERLSNLLKG